MPIQVPVYEKFIRSPFVRRVAAFATRNRLIAPGDTLLVAISGGPDSVALLSVLTALAPAWRLTLHAVHFNYGLRGEESDEDARFVADLCRRMDCELITESVDLGVPARSSKTVWRGRSFQEVAREARYGSMMRIGGALGVNKIAIGHTADDQAETVVMWMLRGAGTAGLSGIPPARGPLFVRPLLEMNRSDILAYLEAKGLAFRTDSTNATGRYLRNRIRHQVMPVLKALNPSIVKVLGRQADLLREEHAWLEQLTQEQVSRMAHATSNGDLVVKRDDLVELPMVLQRRVVRELVRRASGVAKGPTYATVTHVLARVVQGRSGASLVVQGCRIAREDFRLRFGAVDSCEQDALTKPHDLEISLPIPSTESWPLTGQFIQTSLVHSSQAVLEWESCRSRNVAWFDADSVTMNLMVRGWRAGDVFHPLGMGGRRKKLQDYFSDMKVPRKERSRVPLVVAPEGILWVAGHRMDHRFRVTSTTKRMIIIRLTNRVDIQEFLP